MCGQPYTPPTPPPRDKQTGRVYGYHRTPWNETNLHFHGLNVSPKAPSDDVVGVLLCPLSINANPGQFPSQYTYELDIPANEPPGTYWYHPHAHGESDHQLLSGLTGVIIIDTLNKSIPDTLPNRLVVVRDQGTAGEARPRWGGSPSQQHVQFLESQLGPNYYTRPGGYPYGNPDQCPPPNGHPLDAKALTVNHIPLPTDPNTVQGLPDTTIASGETDYYRLANTSSDTILDVVATVNGNPMNINVTSRDSVPLINAKGQPTWQSVPFDHIFVPPASRFEFYLTGTNPGDQIVFTTLTIDSGCWGDITLQRNLFVVNVTASKGKQIYPRVPAVVSHVRQRFSDLYNVKPVAHRTFAFTEYNDQGDFYLTEISNPKAYEKPYTMDGPPDVIVKAGTVEDWTLLDYTQETHMFHIHQIHFLVMKAKDYEFGLGQLLDTVNVPYGAFKSPGDTKGDDFVPGSVTLRMDFRDKDIVGEFPYHCHILAHEDGGMMAKIRVVP
jgi:FtsP/CotA-like multicopper oxidase with cupredoxin domain